jgi:esterase/lipase superfamily enzyme
MAFGSTIVEFGDKVTLDGLIGTTLRGGSVDLRLGRTKEFGRFPPIPYEVAVRADGITRLPSVVEAHERAKRALQAEIGRRLVGVPRKEVVLFIHGYNNSFEDAALTMGELCHFLGREFVCGIFTWPAGGTRGILFGYNIDRESGEYAVEDLLKAIRIISETTGVEKIHLIAHSRGNAILATALAELGAEAYMLGGSLGAHFRIGNVVLAAPDIDADVALSKIFKVFSDPELPFRGAANPSAAVEPSPGFKVTTYVSPDDKALATSSWLSGSFIRLGRIDAKMLTPREIDEMRMLGTVDVVQVRGTTDFFGHDYFVSNPEVSSDIIAMLRYGLKPNDPGRPLEEIVDPFWRVLPMAESSATR